MEHLLTITRKNQIEPLKKSIFYVATLLIAILGTYIYMDDPTFVIKGAIIAVILLIGPAIYLHYCYYLENKDWIIKNFEGCIIISRPKKPDLIIDEKNIKELSIYIGPTMLNYGISGSLPIEEYNYAKFTLENEDVYITSLLCPDVKYFLTKFSSVKRTIHKTIFAQI